MKKATLEITLKSDLCAGSGYSYAGVVDTDSESDQFGLPWIPGRRLKGCMREAAEEILPVLHEKDLDRLFGSRGGKRTGDLIVDNAVLCNYAELLPTVREIQKTYAEKNPPENPADRIFGLFTSIRAQTKMDENGIAEDNSLRFTRVINHYMPDGKTEMRFQADICFADTGEEDIKLVVHALRGIGMHRNRGLGQVQCELKAIRNIPAITRADLRQVSGKNVNKDEKVIIRYRLTAEEPLMLSGDRDNISETMISGRRILGALAGRYPADGNPAEDPLFQDLFLNGTTFFRMPIRKERDSGQFRLLHFFSS